MSHTCTVEDVRRKRRELESELTKLIFTAVSSFQEETDVTVQGVSVNMVSTHVLGLTSARHAVTSVEVDLHI